MEQDNKDQEKKDKIKQLEITLGEFFRHTHSKRCSIQLLYEKGLEIERKVKEIDPKFEERDNFKWLRGAFNFIGQLHDPENREYHTTNREDLYLYSRVLK